nr:MAG TPA: hypothetical protein [Caudoviricetes sp.]
MIDPRFPPCPPRRSHGGWWWSAGGKIPAYSSIDRLFCK